MKLKVLIVDDEPPARADLVHLLGQYEPEWEPREADNGIDAARILGSFLPRLLFLDIQMPGLNGLELMRHLPKGSRPVTVFVTAHRDFAVEAFELEAADYLVKPFRRKRFAEMLERVRRLLEQKGEHAAEPSATLNSDIPRAEGRLRIKDGQRYFFVDVEEVRWISAAGNYVEIHTSQRAYLMRGSLRETESLLAGGSFLRIHRGTLVNRHWIREVAAKDSGDYRVRLECGQTLIMSRRRKAAMRALLGPDI